MASTSITGNGKGGKRGRKPEHYTPTWGGDPIVGLARRPGDRRWRIIGTDITFSEPDEYAAIARYYAWKRTHEDKGMMNMPVATANVNDMQAVRDAILATGTPAPADPRKLRGTFLPPNYPAAAPAPAAQPIRVELDGETLQFLKDPIQSAAYFAVTRKLLLTQADFLAKNTGLPQLANFSAMDLPRASIRLEDLIVAYEQHAKVLPTRKRKVRALWDEFVQLTQAKTLRDLTTEKLLSYADTIRGRSYSQNTVANYFMAVKGVMSHGRKRGLNAEEIDRALSRAAVLAESKTSVGDPKPISKADFAKLLKAAKGDDLMTAALLVMLNCCMYGSEALALEWDDLDLEGGTLVTRRSKTDTVRAAVLWPATVAALEKLPKTPGAIFKSSRGAAYHPNSFRKLFEELRTQAKLPGVEINQIRDGAYSAACAAGVELHLAQILAGHKLPGESDKYILRSPGQVRVACDAVERAYFGKVAR